jgi:hypothetical protein
MHGRCARRKASIYTGRHKEQNYVNYIVPPSAVRIHNPSGAVHAFSLAVWGPHIRECLKRDALFRDLTKFDLLVGLPYGYGLRSSLCWDVTQRIEW